MTPSELYSEAIKLGLRIRPEGPNLIITPKGLCPPDFADKLRAHKQELLVWLEAREADLPEDFAPLLTIAMQILKGEFDGADNSLRASLSIGLNAVNHPRCIEALQKLNKTTEKKL